MEPLILLFGGLLIGCQNSTARGRWMIARNGFGLRPAFFGLFYKAGDGEGREISVLFASDLLIETRTYPRVPPYDMPSGRCERTPRADILIVT